VSDFGGTTTVTRALRWLTVVATGAAVSRPGRLYAARLVGAAAASCVLRDGTADTGPVVLALAIPAAGADDWPKVPVSLPFMHGLHLTLTGTGTVILGWNPD